VSGRRGGLARHLVGWLPLTWLGAFFLAPFAFVVKLALSSPRTAMPPYEPVFDLSGGLERFRQDIGQLGLQNLQTIMGDDLYVASLASSLRLAGLATVILLLIGYPVALALARTPSRWKPLLLALIILPFWTSFLIRVYALIGILRNEGFLNAALMNIGLITQPVAFLNTDGAIVLGLVYAYFPFMILPLFAAVERIDRTLIEAARDLGATAWGVFIPAAGEIIVPDLLGGSDTLMIGRTLWSEFFANRDWPLAAMLALLLLAALLPPILIYRALERRAWATR
jgi:putrescine transport system permease protein